MDFLSVLPTVDPDNVLNQLACHLDFFLQKLNALTDGSSVFDLVRKILRSSPGSGLPWDALGESSSLPRLSDELVGSLNSQYIHYHVF